jgi:hypothetical protein
MRNFLDTTHRKELAQVFHGEHFVDHDMQRTGRQREFIA